MDAYDKLAVLLRRHEILPYVVAELIADHLAEDARKMSKEAYVYIDDVVDQFLEFADMHMPPTQMSEEVPTDV